MALLNEQTLGELQLKIVDASPETSGIAAPVGALALLDDPSSALAGLWLKDGAADTAWARLVPMKRAIKTANQNTTSTALQNITDLSIPVLSGRRYKFYAMLSVQSAALVTGMALGLTHPGGAVLGRTSYPSGAVGTDGLFEGNLTTSGDSVLATSSSVANAARLAIVQGIYTATANGNLQLQFRSETNGTAVQVNADSVLEWSEY